MFLAIKKKRGSPPPPRPSDATCMPILNDLLMIFVHVFHLYYQTIVHAHTVHV